MRERALLREIYAAALAAVEGAQRVEAALNARSLTGPVAAIAIGKAASAMLAGAERALGSALRQALLITKYGHCDERWAGDARVHVIEAAHPVPDANSLAAGAALLEFIEGTSLPLLALISGGASSLVEVPVHGVGLDDLRRLNAHLLASGLDIHQINRVRQAVSRIKGGRLAARLGGRAVRVLAIADVAGNEPAVIGSGLLTPPLTGPLPALPPELVRLLEHAAPAPSLQVFANIDLELVARNEDALAAAAAKGAQLGLKVYRHARFVDGDAVQAGQELVDELRAADPGLHLWGGEPTLELPPQPGRGGRLQSLALAAAKALSGDEHIWLLAGASDGSDGPTADAGALVDGGTWQRILRAGIDPDAALRRADAGTALAAAGDLIRTGPTGTNVMDLMIALKQ